MKNKNKKQTLNLVFNNSHYKPNLKVRNPPFNSNVCIQKFTKTQILFTTIFLTVMMLSFVSAETNTSIMYAKNASGQIAPLEMNEEGRLKVHLNFLNLSAGSLSATGNISLGETITFKLGEIVDNVVDGWVRVTGALNVTGSNFSFGGNLLENRDGVLYWKGDLLSTNVSINYGQNASGATLPYKLSGDGVLQMDIVDELWDYDSTKIYPVDNNLDFDLGSGKFYYNASSGDVGIGTSSPGDILTGLTGANKILQINDSEGGGAIIALNSPDGHWEIGQNTQGDLFIVNGSNTGGIFIDKDNGKVGIGTTTPTSELTVVGQITGTSVSSSSTFTSGSYFYASQSSTGTTPTQLSLNNDGTGDGTGNTIFFRNNRGTALNDASIVVSTPSANNYVQMDFLTEEDGSNGQNTQLRIATNGNTYTSNGAVYSLSDIRVKKNIENLTDGLSLLNKLHPVTFEYNGKADMATDDGETQYGFIADEVLDVAPQYVTISKDIIDGVEVDDFKSLSTTQFIPMMIKSIQEQQEIIEDLKKRIEVLENAG